MGIHGPNRGIAPGDAIALVTGGLLGPLSGLAPVAATGDPIDAVEAAIAGRPTYRALEYIEVHDYQGLAVPLAVGFDGRSQLVRGEEQLRKLIGLAFSDLDSANEYQDLGVEHDMVFDPQNKGAVNSAHARVTWALADFTDRLTFTPNDIRIVEGHDTGDFEVHFRYIEKDTGQVRKIVEPLPRGATA